MLTTPALAEPMARDISSKACATVVGRGYAAGAAAAYDVVTEYMSKSGNDNFSMPVRAWSYMLTECRLNEHQTIGDAYKHLVQESAAGQLPAIPAGGATDDPEELADRDAFRKWIHHQGPRPVWAGVPAPNPPVRE
jgi:hypothetical protein